MTKNETKTIVRTSIFKINAERRLLCGPPALWEAEVAMDVYYSDGTCEVQYLSAIDLDESGYQVATISMDDFSDEEESIEPYLVASFETLEEALASPYGDSVRIFDDLFNRIAVI